MSSYDNIVMLDCVSCKILYKTARNEVLLAGPGLHGARLSTE